jgi:hypothetical protein
MVHEQLELKKEGKAETVLMVKERKTFSSIPKSLELTERGWAKKRLQSSECAILRMKTKLNNERIKVKLE